MSFKSKAHEISESIKDSAHDMKEEIKDKTHDLAEKGATSFGTHEAKKKFGLETKDQIKNASGPIYEISFRIIRNK